MSQTIDDFTISLKADSLLTDLEGDFSDMILGVACHRAKPDADGTRVVTANEIKSVANELRAILVREMASGQIPSEMIPHVKKLTLLFEKIASEPSQE